VAPITPNVAGPRNAITQEEFVVLEGDAKRSVECSIDWMRGAAKSEAGVGERIVDAGLADELKAVATHIAKEQRAHLIASHAPENAGEASELDLTAIFLAKDAAATREAKVEAIAWTAYFMDRIAQGNCPPGAALLRRIGKFPVL
jgi:hypothetical protein